MKKLLFRGPTKIDERVSATAWCHLSFCFGCDRFIVPEPWNCSFYYFDIMLLHVAIDITPLFGPLISLPLLNEKPSLIAPAAFQFYYLAVAFRSLLILEVLFYLLTLGGFMVGLFGSDYITHYFLVRDLFSAFRSIFGDL